MKRFALGRFVTLVCASSLMGSTAAYASAFQLYEQDGAAIGTYHAGYAASANDASTAFYNPAGIVRFQNQQVVIGSDVIMTDYEYRGSLGLREGTPPIVFTKSYQNIVAQGGTFNVVPFLHYVAPIADWIGFGFSIDVPFGLKTDYGRSTPLRYAATLTSIIIVDVSPSLGIKLTDKASIGFGVDLQRAYGEFDSVGTLIAIPNTDTTSTNRANGTGYGYHLGALYQFTPDTRVGVSYHSQVVHHLSGSSKFEGPIANTFNNGPLDSARLSARLTLPPYTAFSIYHRVMPQLALMGSAIYTQWSTFRGLTLTGVSGAVNLPFPFIVGTSNDIQVTVPEFYRNTWNFTFGTEYYASEALTFRGGLGYDQTPVRGTYRNVQLPDNNRYVVALGSHFQATKTVGVDIGWTHVFLSKAKVNPPAQVAGGQTVTTNGTATGGADVIGGQIVWDII